MKSLESADHAGEAIFDTVRTLLLHTILTAVVQQREGLLGIDVDITDHTGERIDHTRTLLTEFQIRISGALTTTRRLIHAGLGESRSCREEERSYSALL